METWIVIVLVALAAGWVGWRVRQKLRQPGVDCGIRPPQEPGEGRDSPPPGCGSDCCGCAQRTREGGCGAPAPELKPRSPAP